MKIILDLTAAEVEKLSSLLHDVAVDSEDDGNEGNPNVKLLWKVLKQIDALNP